MFALVWATAMSPLLAYHFSDMFGNMGQINFGKIGESDEREFLFDMPCKDRGARDLQNRIPLPPRPRDF
jgi:hypothetical protein